MKEFIPFPFDESIKSCSFSKEFITEITINSFNWGCDANNPVLESLMVNFFSKFGKEFPYFNLLFYYEGVYVLDKLVGFLSVKKIKKLNGLGFIIGKTVNFKKLNKRSQFDVAK